jgi:sulfite reductase alpha subunit-like flavoprotein
MYPDFCQAGKTVKKLLANAGAQMMAPATTADEAVDSAGTIAQWLKLMKTLVLPDSLDAAIEARMGVANEPLMYKSDGNLNIRKQRLSDTSGQWISHRFV